MLVIIVFLQYLCFLEYYGIFKFDNQKLLLVIEKIFSVDFINFVITLF